MLGQRTVHVLRVSHDVVEPRLWLPLGIPEHLFLQGRSVRDKASVRGLETELPVDICLLTTGDESCRERRRPLSLPWSMRNRMSRYWKCSC